MESKEKVLSYIEGVLLALKDIQEKKGEFAEIYCSVVEEHLKKIKSEVKKI